MSEDLNEQIERDCKVSDSKLEEQVRSGQRKPWQVSKKRDKTPTIVTPNEKTMPGLIDDLKKLIPGWTPPPEKTEEE